MPEYGTNFRHAMLGDNNTNGYSSSTVNYWYQPQSKCPCCGHCPHCGRGGGGNYIPYYPEYTRPYWNYDQWTTTTVSHPELDVEKLREAMQAQLSYQEAKKKDNETAKIAAKEFMDGLVRNIAGQKKDE